MHIFGPLSFLYRDRAMRNNAIPLDLHKVIFPSCITHAIDNVLGARTIWAIKYKIDVNREITN